MENKYLINSKKKLFSLCNREKSILITSHSGWPILSGYSPLILAVAITYKRAIKTLSKELPTLDPTKRFSKLRIQTQEQKENVSVPVPDHEGDWTDKWSRIYKDQFWCNKNNQALLVVQGKRLVPLFHLKSYSFATLPLIRNRIQD